MKSWHEPCEDNNIARVANANVTMESIAQLEEFEAPGQVPETDNGQKHDAIRLDIWVRDPDLVDAVGSIPDGRQREEYTLGALKIGVIALRHAQGRIDTEAVRSEGDRLIANL